MDRLSYFLRRVLLMVPTFVGITLVCFALCQVVPGGPVEQALARLREAEQRRDEADRYAARVLEELAEKLRIISKQVDNGLDLLRQNLELGGAAPAKPERRS